MVLDAGRFMEATGLYHAQAASRLARRGHGVCMSTLRALSGNGVALTDLERAVHRRVQVALGHGAFAAVQVGLFAADGQDVAGGLSAQDILADPGAVGCAEHSPTGAPFVLLGRRGDLAQCLLLTWCGRWQAFHGALQTQALRFGESPFREALVRHPEAVNRLLGTAAPTPRSAFS